MVKKKPVVTKKSSAVKKTKSAKRSPIVNKAKPSANKKSVLKKKAPANQIKAVRKSLKSTRVITKKPIKKTAVVKKIVAKKKPVVKKAAPKKSIAKKTVARTKSKKVAPAKIKSKAKIKPSAKAKAITKKTAVTKKKPIAKLKKTTPAKKLSRPVKKAPVKKVALKKPVLKKLPQKKTTIIKTKPIVAKKTATPKLQPRNKPVVIKKDQKNFIPQATNKKMIVTNKSTHSTPTHAINPEYMTPAHLSHFQQLLKRWKEDLMARVDKTIHHMQDEAANFADPNDRATQEEEFSLELRTRDRERKLMMKIDEAIERIEAGDYGFCTECGIGIGLERLEARPTATLCIDCKTLDEIREKQMAD